MIRCRYSIIDDNDDDVVVVQVEVSDSSVIDKVKQNERMDCSKSSSVFDFARI